MNRYDEDEVYRSILNACVLAVSEGFPHLAVREVIAPPHGWRDAELARQVVAYLMAAEFELPKRRIAQVQECDRKRIRSAVFTIGARLESPTFEAHYRRMADRAREFFYARIEEAA